MFQIKLPSGSYLTVDEFDWGISIFFGTTKVRADFEGLCREAWHLDKLTEKESLFNSPISTPKSFPALTKMDDMAAFCACYGHRTANITHQDCRPSVIRTPLDDYGYDVTDQIMHYQSLVEEGVSHNLRSHHDATKTVLQADSPSHPTSYDQRRNLCQSILNETGPSLICLEALGKDLWNSIYQICLQDAQVTHIVARETIEIESAYILLP